MKSEEEIRQRIEELDKAIAESEENGEIPILVPQRKRALEWVLGESDGIRDTDSDHWTAQREQQR